MLLPINLLLAIQCLPSLGALLGSQQNDFSNTNGADNSTSSIKSKEAGHPKTNSDSNHNHNQQVDFSKYDSNYSFNLNQIHYPNWMTFLPSTTNLTSLSIPGTHNSMTYDTSWYYQCQNENLTTQLDSGIRYIDIRARVIDNDLMVFHGDMSTHHSFAEVLTDLFGFLHKTPGEVILMRLKEEMGTLGHTYEGNSNITFQQAFAHYITKNPITKHGAHKHIWIPEVKIDLYQVPTLGELRGKILILQDFGVDTAVAEFGIHWGSTLLKIEDAYNIPVKEGLLKKEAAIQDNLIGAMKGTEEGGDGSLYLTYLSGSGGIESMNVAAGEGGINDQTGKFLASKENEKGAFGIVVMDVPGAQLVEEILKRNPTGNTPSDWSGLQLDEEDNA